jgi:hypothetical protein
MPPPDSFHLYLLPLFEPCDLPILWTVSIEIEMVYIASDYHLLSTEDGATLVQGRCLCLILIYVNVIGFDFGTYSLQRICCSRWKHIENNSTLLRNTAR